MTWELLKDLPNEQFLLEIRGKKFKYDQYPETYLIKTSYYKETLLADLYEVYPEGYQKELFQLFYFRPNVIHFRFHRAWIEIEGILDRNLIKLLPEEKGSGE